MVTMLALAEYLMHEPVPLHQVHSVIFDFCRGRSDAVVFGAQAVNAHVTQPRMSQDVDLMSPNPEPLANELARVLQERLHIAARVRAVAAGKGFRVYQLRKEGNRHLADVRHGEVPLADVSERDGIRYTGVALTTVMKARAFAHRRMTPKGATDLADLRRLILAHPELRDAGTVSHLLGEPEDAAALEAWNELLRTPIVSDEDADEGY